MREYLGAMRTKTWCRSPVGDGSSVVGRSRGVGRRSRRRCGANPLASAPLLIGFRVRVCGGAAGTVNIGSRAPACLCFIWRCVRGGHCHKTADAPDQGTSQIRKPIRRSVRRDHFPNRDMIGSKSMGHRPCAKRGQPARGRRK
jgi:hypothetical protein